MSDTVKLDLPAVKAAAEAFGRTKDESGDYVALQHAITAYLSALTPEPASRVAEPDGPEVETLSDERLIAIRDNHDNGMAARVMAGELLIARRRTTEAASAAAEPVACKHVAPWSYDEREGDYLDAGGHMIGLHDDDVVAFVLAKVNALPNPPAITEAVVDDLIRALGNMLMLSDVRAAAEAVAPLWLKDADEVFVRARQSRSKDIREVVR